MDVPDQKGRVAILNVHAKNKVLGQDIDLKEVALRTPGFSGADLANLLNEVGSAKRTGLRSGQCWAGCSCLLPRMTPGGLGAMRLSCSENVPLR